LARLSDVRLIHSQGTLAHVHGALAAQLAGGVPELWQLEDPPPCESRTDSPLSILDRTALSVPLDTVAGLMPSLSSPFGGALTCPIEPILQEGKISNLLSLPTPEEQNRARKRIGISDHELLITALGRQDHFQGHENLIRIVEPLITQENLSIRLLFLGATLSGLHGYPESLRKTCRQLNLESQISFAGMQSPEQTRALIASSLCVAHAAPLPPSELIIETSLALGTPIVSCSANASSPQFLHEKTGLLVPPSSLVAFRSSLARIVKDHSLRNSLSEGARSRMAKVIDLQLGERLETMYQSLLCHPHRL
jgi:glycosyltransferase involved in cell wall biosynthesis